jgi:hypothetical protein
MKKLLLSFIIPAFFISLFLTACEKQYGEGTDPKVNITNYTFPKEGGSLDLFSRIDLDFALIYESTRDSMKEKPVEEYKNGVYKMETSWYIISRNRFTNECKIEVKSNTTGKERLIPVILSAGDWGNNRVTYKQDK